MADKTTPPGSSVSSPLTHPPTDGKTTLCGEALLY